MEDTERVIPTDDELRKRLFSTPSPNKTARESEEDDRAAGNRPSNGRGARPRRKPRKAGFRLSLLAVMLFLLLCAFALVAALNPDDDSWRKITWDRAKEGAVQFFSNEPLNGERQTTQALFGLLGALPLAAAIGVATGAFTCLFMFYDSDVPGDFPPTPVSPRKATDPSPSESRWHLGYIFVPVNALVAFSLALYYLRLHQGLGIL